jgi:protein-S-isoprenylcysteine O-methyltransferase Ste14
MTDLDSTGVSIALVVAIFIALAPLEIFRAPWRHQPAAADPLRVIALRTWVKILGCACGLALVAFLYWLLPEYRRPFYEPFFAALWQIVPLAPLVIAYFHLAEWRFPSGDDGYWQMGMLAIGRWRSVEVAKLRQNVLAWIIRGFFLPIMFSDLVSGVNILREIPWPLGGPLPSLVDNIVVACFTLELTVVVAGYAAPCLLLNNQIRKIEGTGLGWIVTLICYGPFYAFLFSHYLAYRTDFTWSSWLADRPIAAVVWGMAIMLTALIHLWSDSCLGLRFSNLTNRGIVTNGAYRICKHPAYLFKNIKWWLISVPFAAQGSAAEAIRLSLLLVCVNCIYLARSACEERLLAQDPDYVAYALWMERFGPLRVLGRICPVLRFSYRQEYWGFR